MSWQDWLEESLPEHLDTKGDLIPPWARFPEYERYTIGWRMGEGETWMGLWYCFMKGLPGLEARLAYLRRHPKAPENWADILYKGLCPRSSGKLSQAQLHGLVDKGLVEPDAAYHNWLAQGAKRVLPWTSENTATEAARYRTRAFSFWSRAYRNPDTREARQVSEPPARWFAGLESCRSGLGQLSAMLLKGEVVPPWQLGLEPEDKVDSLDMDMSYVDAFGLWVGASFDDRESLGKFLANTRVPASWGAWCLSRAPLIKF